MSGSGSRSCDVASPTMTSPTGSVAIVLPTDPGEPQSKSHSWFLFDFFLSASMWLSEGHNMLIRIPVSILSMQSSLSLRLSGAAS